MEPFIKDGMLFFKDKEGNVFQAEVEQNGVVEPIQLTKHEA